MNLILAYLQYQFKALFTIRKNDTLVGLMHGYLNNRSENIAFEQELQGLRQISKRSNRTILIKDFGAGSKKLGNERRIADIYNTSVATLKYQRMLYFISKERNCQNILELGTSLGFSTVYLSKGSAGKVTTVEACPAIFKEATALFSELKLKNVKAINSTFVDYFETYKNETYDFVYIDGHHDGEALLKYVEILKPQLAQNAVLVVDDIRWSKSMHDAWTRLLSDPFFAESADLFRMGVLVC